MAISEVSQEGSIVSAFDLDHESFDVEDVTNLDNMAGFIIRGGRTFNKIGDL